MSEPSPDFYCAPCDVFDYEPHRHGVVVWWDCRDEVRWLAGGRHRPLVRLFQTERLRRAYAWRRLHGERTIADGE